MGVIKRQAISGTIYTYIGAILGFIISVLIFPRIFEKDQIGLLGVLIAYAGIFGQFGGLGLNITITRMFSYFRTKDNSHNGFLFLILIIGLFGFIISMIIFFAAKPLVINNESSGLLSNNYLYIIPLILFPNLFFRIFDTYSKVLFNAVRGTFLKEVLIFYKGFYFL